MKRDNVSGTLKVILKRFISIRLYIQQIMTAYLSTLQKWCVLRDGHLIKNLPTYVPGHEFLSKSRARSLKVPYTKKEAMFKFVTLHNALDDTWLGNKVVSKRQKEVVNELLNLGAYSLPRLILTSPLLDMHLQDVLEKDVIKCFDDLRKGNSDISDKYRKIQKII